MEFYGAALSSVLLLLLTFTSCTFLRYFSPDILLHVVRGDMHPRAHFSADELVRCSACTHQFMLGLEIRPRPTGEESDAALPGFQSSYLHC